MGRASATASTPPWPAWAAPLLAAVAEGVAPARAAVQLGSSSSAVSQLAARRADFAAALAEARAAGAAVERLPAWAEGLLADVASGYSVVEAAERAGIVKCTVYVTARRLPGFAARLAEARQAAPLQPPRPRRPRKARAALQPVAPALAEAAATSGKLQDFNKPTTPAQPAVARYSLDSDSQAYEGLALIAVGVVEVAQRDAAKGDAAARQWIEQLQADLIEAAPEWLCRRVAA